MRASVTQRNDGAEEDCASCKSTTRGNNDGTNPSEKLWPIHVPAAAVIHE